MRDRLLAVLTLCGCLAGTGCSGMRSISELSGVPGDLREAFPGVTSDIAESCVRRNQLRADVPRAEGPEPLLDCKPYAGLAEQISTDQAVLIRYLEALVQLAANQTPAYPATIRRASGEIATLPGVSAHAAAATSAAGGLITALADAATSGYRERSINRLLVATDPSVQELCTALEKVVAADYESLLDDEELETRSFYSGPLAERKERDERLTLLLVTRQRSEDMARLKRHRNAAMAYVSTLEQIARFHAQLTEAAKRHTARNKVEREMAPTLAAVKDAVSELKVRLH